MNATLYNPQQAHIELKRAWEYIKSMTMAGHRLRLSVKPETRSIEQNARMWAMLGEVADQVDWYGRKLSAEDWKCVFSAALKKQDVVPGLHNDFVVLGTSTSKMTIAEMSDLITLMEAFGADKSVKFSNNQG